MNCKNVEPLLSLYVGRDLEEEQSRLVAAHLQSCTECTLAADEYAGASQLLQRYEPPVLSDEIYTGIREQVLNEIERGSHAPAWPGIVSQLFLALVQPRMRLITATLLLAIAVTALYLSRNSWRQLPNERQVAVRTEEPNQAGSGADVRSGKSNESSGSSSFSNKGQIRVTTTSRPTTGKRQRAVAVSRPSSAPAPLRVEMQTSNQNIRIIWLSDQRPGALGTDSSKGI